jgi:adenylate cyclase
MLYAHTPARAVELGLRIIEDVGSRHYFPVVRVGMHPGAAVERAGDWFGAAVNLAARVSAAAGGSEVLLTSSTRDAAGTLAGVELHPRGRRAFKNVAEHVELFAAVRTGAQTEAGLPIDPVCRMAVDPLTAPASSCSTTSTITSVRSSAPTRSQATRGATRHREPISSEQQGHGRLDRGSPIVSSSRMV